MNTPPTGSAAMAAEGSGWHAAPVDTVVAGGPVDAEVAGGTVDVGAWVVDADAVDAGVVVEDGDSPGDGSGAGGTRWGLVVVVAVLGGRMVLGGRAAVDGGEMTGVVTVVTVDGGTVGGVTTGNLTGLGTLRPAVVLGTGTPGTSVVGAG
jgi:hypothetical protein